MLSFEQGMEITRAQIEHAGALAARLSKKRRQLAAFRRAIQDACLAMERDDAHKGAIYARVDDMIDEWKADWDTAVALPPKPVVVNLPAGHDTFDCSFDEEEPVSEFSATESFAFIVPDEPLTSGGTEESSHARTPDEDHGVTSTDDRHTNWDSMETNGEGSDDSDMAIPSDVFAWSSVVSPPPHSTSIRAKLSANSSLLVANTGRRGTRTLEEFEQKRRRGILRGEQTKTFNKWFSERKPATMRRPRPPRLGTTPVQSSQPSISTKTTTLATRKQAWPSSLGDSTASEDESSTSSRSSPKRRTIVHSK